MWNTLGSPLKVWAKRIVLLLLGLIAVCLVFAFVYARIKDREALSDLPAGSQLVDIGDRSIHYSGFNS
ncbi:MAG: hypothetical protein AB1649_15830 [Chloroflexota bacterium]